jgi:hypothetical protein
MTSVVLTAEFVLGGMRGDGGRSCYPVVNPLDPGAAIAWPLPVEASNPAQISAKDVGAPGFRTDASR